MQNIKKGILYLDLFLALLDCVSRANAVVQASVVVVIRPSIKHVFSETVKQINAKFCGKVAIHHISRYLHISSFQNFGFLNFSELFSFSLTWDPTPPTITILFQPDVSYIFLVTVLTKLAYRNFENSNSKVF